MPVTRGTNTTLFRVLMRQWSDDYKIFYILFALNVLSVMKGGITNILSSKSKCQNNGPKLHFRGINTLNFTFITIHVVWKNLNMYSVRLGLTLILTLHTLHATLTAVSPYHTCNSKLVTLHHFCYLWMTWILHIPDTH